jgi:ATP-dependent DNA helicase
MTSSITTPSSLANDESTPASSPPSADIDMEKGTGISEAMLREEERMQRAAEKKQAARDDKMEAERRKDLKAGTEAVDKKFKALEYLLNQSKVSRIAE